MPRDAAYVAVYDVTSDRERTRLAKVLEGFGLRVQYSAFELRLTPATRKTLLRRVEDLKLESGFLYLYRRAGNHDRAAVGQVPDDPLAETEHAFVVSDTNETLLPRKDARRSQHRTKRDPMPAPNQVAVENQGFNPVLAPALESALIASDDDATPQVQGSAASSV
ncbi:MAG: CRISPR-associated endonuclease Cas2 [Verrucomicrobia bacterium]|nr:CRISPR-associated endonuclease Cas2 [Verrucomicrobiota bacterium]